MTNIQTSYDIRKRLMVTDFKVNEDGAVCHYKIGENEYSLIADPEQFAGLLVSTATVDEWRVDDNVIMAQYLADNGTVCTSNLMQFGKELCQYQWIHIIANYEWMKSLQVAAQKARNTPAVVGLFNNVNAIMFGKQLNQL